MTNEQMIEELNIKQHIIEAYDDKVQESLKENIRLLAESKNKSRIISMLQEHIKELNSKIETNKAHIEMGEQQLLQGESNESSSN